MKKSEIYHTLLLLTLNSDLSNDKKLAILNQLFSDESVALYTEGQSND